MENTQENLPNWDLSDLYKGMDDPKIAQDKSNLGILSKKFEERYKGNVENLDGDRITSYNVCYTKLLRCLPVPTGCPSLRCTSRPPAPNPFPCDCGSGHHHL